MSEADNNLNGAAFSSAFSRAIAEVLTRAAGERWEVSEAVAPERSPGGTGQLCFQAIFEGAFSGDCYVEVEASQASILGPLVGQAAAASPGEDPAKADSADAGGADSVALKELLQSAATECSRLLTPGLPPSAVRVEAASQPSAGSTQRFLLSARAQEGKSATLVLAVDPQVLESLAAVNSVQRGGPKVETRPGNAPRPGMRGEAENADNLKLVMGVELNVVLRFGQRTLTLREVIELSSGSLIELDREVDAPVELLLDGRVIARGEAVVIDGYYGLRVTDVPRLNSYQPRSAGEGL